MICGIVVESLSESYIATEVSTTEVSETHLDLSNFPTTLWDLAGFG